MDGMVAAIGMDDELYEAAVEVAGERRAVSARVLCHRLHIGSPRAQDLVAGLEAAGIVGPFVPNVGHEVLET